MDFLKVGTRGQLAWQCICQTRRNLHSATIQGTKWRILETNNQWSYSKHNNGLLISNMSTRFTVGSCSRMSLVNPLTKNSYSTESTSKEELSDTTNTVVNMAKQENLSTDEDETESTETSQMSQQGELLPSEQEQFEWENKLDKLYKVIELEVLAYEPSVLDSYQWFVLSTATHLGIQVGKCWSPLKSDKLRFQLLKSAFVHKKHQVHYEVRTHHRFLTFHKLTSSTADTFLEYIERNIPEGVGLKVTKVESKALPNYLQQSH